MLLATHKPLDVALTQLLQRSAKILGIPSHLAVVQYSNKGVQFQCNAALASARILKKSPRDIAQLWIETLTVEEKSLFSILDIAGPGFINLSLTDESLAHWVEASSQDERFFVPHSPTPKKVYLDFGGYNVAKQLHIGHLRSTIIGDTLQRIFRFMGDEVVSDVHLGDWGTQMGMLIEAIRTEQPDAIFFSDDFDQTHSYPAPITIDDMNRLYPTASARSKTDEAFRAKASQATAALQQGHAGYRALWRHFVDLSIHEVKQDIAVFDVNFDLWLGESDVQSIMPQLVQNMIDQGKAHLSEGALILPIVDAKGKEMVPVMLRKSDGGATYHTSDLATISMRAQEQANSMLYVVDARQEMHFKQVFAGAHQSEMISQDIHLEHIKFGTINGADGRPFKTRSGDTVKLRDVVEMALTAARTRLNEGGILSDANESDKEAVAQAVAIAAIKFGDLSNHRTSDYILNLDDFCSFEGKTGPYLLYAAVRIKSILQKASQLNIHSGAIQLSCDTDRVLALELTKFPMIMVQVHQKKTPHLLCEYLFNVAQAFSSFYQQCNIVRESNVQQQSAWLHLVEQCLEILHKGLSLLGIKIPDRM
jgi:arginyl-tRNA synthetase